MKNSLSPWRCLQDGGGGGLASHCHQTTSASSASLPLWQTNWTIKEILDLNIRAPKLVFLLPGNSEIISPAGVAHA